MATAKKKIIITKKESAFLNKKGATPTESLLWGCVRDIHAKTETPVTSSEIRKETKTHRTGVRWHLNNMIKKGLITKPSHKFYLPVLAD